MCADQTENGKDSDKNILPGLTSDEQQGGLFVRNRANKKETNSPQPKKSLLGLDQLAKERKKIQLEDNFKVPKKIRTVSPSREHVGDEALYKFRNSREKRGDKSRDRRAIDRRYRHREEDTPGSLHGYQVKRPDRWDDRRHPLYATSRHHKEDKKGDRSSSRRERSRREEGEYTPTPNPRWRKEMLTPSRAAWDDNDAVRLRNKLH